MNENRTCLVGRDSDDGWILAIIMIIVVIGMIVGLIVYAGAFIGGFHALKNYFASFKHNVIDSNRQPVPVA